MKRFALPADTLIFPATDVDHRARARIAVEDGDWIVSRPRSRKTSRVVDAPGAQLLGEFRAPASIAEAVVRFSEREGLVADQVLDQSFGFLSSMIGTGFLVEEEVVERSGVRLDAEVGPWCVVQRLQELEDTAVAVVRGEDGADAV